MRKLCTKLIYNPISGFVDTILKLDRYVFWGQDHEPRLKC